MTRNGRSFVQLVPARSRGGVDFRKLSGIRRELELKKLEADALWPAEFDDHDFSWKVLGLDGR